MGRTSTARERIVGAARTLMAQRGYAALGTAEICRAAGVPKGSGALWPSCLAILGAGSAEPSDRRQDGGRTGACLRWESAPPRYVKTGPDQVLSSL